MTRRPPAKVHGQRRTSANATQRRSGSIGWRAETPSNARTARRVATSIREIGSRPFRPKAHFSMRPRLETRFQRTVSVTPPTYMDEPDAGTTGPLAGGGPLLSLHSLQNEPFELGP